MSGAGLWIIALLMLYKADMGENQLLGEPNVPFPPAPPTSFNLEAICKYSNGRPRYPASFFPVSGASHFRRRGTAINRLESWYSLCCSGQVPQQPGMALCCAQQAWKQALSQFCVEEYSTMTAAYDCCQDQGTARWKCFSTDLPNPSYSPTPGYTAPHVPHEQGFIFNYHKC